MDLTKDLAWTTWTGKTGSVGTKTIVFTTGGAENYFLIWGIHNGGALSIDDIKLEVNNYQYDINGRLIRYYTPDFKVINFYYDTNGNLIKKTKN